MIEMSFYDTVTGLFTGTHFCASSDDGSIAANTPDGHAFIPGHHDHLSRRVDIATGEVVDYQPPAPSADHEWIADTKRWQVTAAVQAKARARVAAVARIAQLEASQHAVVRDLLLGDLSARAKLQAVADEIAKLSADL